MMQQRSSSSRLRLLRQGPAGSSPSPSPGIKEEQDGGDGRDVAVAAVAGGCSEELRDAGQQQQREEKQLFERFWKGTFKAVATPRPGSVIAASITTARRRVTETESRACQTLGTDHTPAEGAAESSVYAADRNNGCIRGNKGRKHGGHHRRHRHHHHHHHHRARSPSSEEDLSPRPTPKAKKKKRKSERKRKRKRSPSYSLSPPRKKKKTKKKKRSSKKSKRHRYTSKKSKHSSSSLKRKRKEERKHKKSSRSHSHRRRRYRRSESDTSTESRHLQNSVERLEAIRKDGKAALQPGDLEWRPAAKSGCQTTPNYRSRLSASSILSSKPGSAAISRAEEPAHHHRTLSDEGPRDYDSGNDTSSPPSSKTGGIARLTVGAGEDKRSGLASPPPEKPKFTDGDNASDSGNSLTSYVSLCRTHTGSGLSDTILHGNGTCKPMITLAGCRGEGLLLPSGRAAVSSSGKRLTAPRSCSGSRSRGRSSSSGSSRYSGRSCSPSRSLSSDRLYSRSQSYSADVRRRGSADSSSSRGSYSRYSPNRVRRKRRKPLSRDRDTKQKAGVSGGKRRRRKSYSPMRKRRRDSPSHLEARRITSARKRPIPYFRPSPSSSSSRSSSVSCWSRLFARSRSRSRSSSSSSSSSIRSRSSRSRSNNGSYSSSYRSYSRSSSWNSIFGTSTRSRGSSTPPPPHNKHSRVRH